MLTATLSILFATKLRQKADPILGKEDKRVYYVGTAHLDTNWLWTIQKTIGAYIPKTLYANFRLFSKYPDYIFSFEGAIRYMFIKEYYPALFRELKRYIALGRWRVAGSAIVAGDVNLPSPESLIRQTLYANQFFKQEFHKQSVDYFLPDCFGFSYALPSIETHLGLKGFSTQKLYWGSSVGIPFPVGFWKGVDGTGVVAALDPGSYTSVAKANAANNPQFIRQADEVGRKSGAYVVYRYHGTGDTGGSPTEQSVKNLESQIHTHGALKVLSAASDQLYRDLSPQQIAKLPVYRGELLLTTHGTGCFTSQAFMKYLNRRNELLADAAERASCAADWLGIMHYPTARLRQNWIRFLWHQFHDDLTGTSIPSVYEYSWNDEALSLNGFQQIMDGAVASVASALNTKGAGVPVVVYNALSWARNTTVDASLQDLPTGSLEAVGPNGTATPVQRMDHTARGTKISFAVAVPANGFAVYHVCRGAARPAPLLVTSRSLENGRFRVKIDENGDISSIYDKLLKREILSAPIRLELRTDISPDWTSWEIKYPTELGPPRAYVSGPATIRAAGGTVHATITIDRSSARSRFVQTVSLDAGDGPVVVHNWVDWRSMGTLLKAVFPFAVSNPTATYDLGLGTISRPSDTSKKYEVPAQQWADISAPNGSWGVAVANDCKYGWDKPNDSTLRLTLLHTANGEGHWQFQETNDLGIHRFTFEVLPHKGNWQHGDVQAAASLNQPLLAFQTVAHSGPLGKRWSLLALSDPNVKIEAVKQAENGSGLIVRVFEASGRAKSNVTLSACAPIQFVHEVDGQENPINPKGQFSLRHGKLVFGLAKYQPRAFLIRLAPSRVAVDHPSIAEMPLKANTTVTEWGRTVTDHGGPGAHPRYAAGNWPHAIQLNFGSLELHSGSPSKPNATACEGQTIALPAGATQLVLLASSAKSDATVDFKVGRHSEDRTIPYFSGRIASWYDRIVNGRLSRAPTEFGRAYLKPVPIAWADNHTVSDGVTIPYIYGYWFKVKLSVPAGARTLKLPNEPGVRVAAIGWVKRPLPNCRQATPTYKWPTDKIVAKA